MHYLVSKAKVVIPPSRCGLWGKTLKEMAQSKSKQLLQATIGPFTKICNDLELNELSYLTVNADTLLDWSMSPILLEGAKRLIVRYAQKENRIKQIHLIFLRDDDFLKLRIANSFLLAMNKGKHWAPDTRIKLKVYGQSLANNHSANTEDLLNNIRKFYGSFRMWINSVRSHIVGFRCDIRFNHSPFWQEIVLPDNLIKAIRQRKFKKENLPSLDFPEKFRRFDPYLLHLIWLLKWCSSPQIKFTTQRGGRVLAPVSVQRIETLHKIFPEEPLLLEGLVWKIKPIFDPS